MTEQKKKKLRRSGCDGAPLVSSKEHSHRFHRPSTSFHPTRASAEGPSLAHGGRWRTEDGGWRWDPAILREAHFRVKFV